MSEKPDSEYPADLMKAFATNTYKLGAVAAELGMTGEETAEELATAVRKLKAALSGRNFPKE